MLMGSMGEPRWQRSLTRTIHHSRFTALQRIESMPHAPIYCAPAAAHGDDVQSQHSRVGPACDPVLPPGRALLAPGDEQAHFTDPLASVLQCRSRLDAAGCVFEQQLGSMARALGADSNNPPSSNAAY